MAAAQDLRNVAVDPWAVGNRAADNRAEQVFNCIRAFLALHRLSPDPAHYAFAHRVICDPTGTLARSVATLTDGGLRLSERDVATLVGTADALQPDPVDDLIARTQMQVAGFSDIVRSIHADTQDFGRDLAASADAFSRGDGAEDVVRLTSMMLARVHAAEARLAVATSEADDLRIKLEEARDNARRDPLTDLPNRRAFEEAFEKHSEAGTPLCLAVCDVDRFKRVNDKFGHSVGDRVLKAIAAALSVACDGYFVARYGGEEFTVLFAGLDLAQARVILERAREAVAAKRYRLRESDEPLGAVTFSGGLTQSEPGECLGAVFGRADKLLYAAKDAGRNQVHVK